MPAWSETSATIDVDHGTTVVSKRLGRIRFEKVFVIVIAIDPEDVPEGRVGNDTDDEARRELLVEAALDDADDVAIACSLKSRRKSKSS